MAPHGPVRAEGCEATTPSKDSDRGPPSREGARRGAGPDQPTEDLAKANQLEPTLLQTRRHDVDVDYDDDEDDEDAADDVKVDGDVCEDGAYVNGDDGNDVYDSNVVLGAYDDMYGNAHNNVKDGDVGNGDEQYDNVDDDGDDNENTDGGIVHNGNVESDADEYNATKQGFTIGRRNCSKMQCRKNTARVPNCCTCA